MDRRPRLGLGFVRIDTDREGSRKGLEVDHDAGLELGLHALQIELVVTHETFRKLRGQQSDRGKLLAGYVEVERVVLGHDAQDLDLQGIAGLGFADVDGTRDRVRSAARVVLAQLDDLLHLDAWFDLTKRVRKGFDGHRVARMNDEFRLLIDVIPTPLHVLRRRGQRIMRRSRRRGSRCSGELCLAD